MNPLILMHSKPCLTASPGPILRSRAQTGVPRSLQQPGQNLTRCQVKTLNAVEQARPMQEKLESGASRLSAGWQESGMPACGVVMQCGDKTFIMAVDSFIGHAEVVIRPLRDTKPKGIAGTTLTADGTIVLLLDMEALLSMQTQETTAGQLG